MGGQSGRTRRLPSAAASLQWLFSPPTTTREQALTRMETTSAVTHLMSSLEHLFRPAERRVGGMNNWEITRETTAITHPAVRRAVDVASRPAVTTGIHCLRVASALTLVSPVRHRGLRMSADLALSATSLLLHPRHHYGTDGSDQVSFLVQSVAALGRAAGSRSRVVDAALWTVGIQSSMSYAVSGWAKLVGPTWRQGRALQGITRTLTYGDRRTWELIRAHPRLARLLGAGVLFLECSFPLAYLGRGRLARPYVAATAAMHLSIARIMALGRFVPAFISMHPAVLYTARERGTTGAAGAEVRSDTVAQMSAVAGVGLLAAAAVARRSISKRARAGRGDEQWLRTTDGNTLAYRRWGSEDPTTPLYVFEAGLLSTSEHWEWMADELAAAGTVLTYQRAGYGRSSALPGTAMVLDDLVEHAVELVDTLAGERPVVLVGHSLGGYLALRTAARATADVRALVLVDASHPDELRRSQRQAKGAEHLTQAFPLMATSLEFGLGMLLDVPDWVKALPGPAQPTALAQYRDPRHWRAAQREWMATLRDFESAPVLPRLRVPVLALSAEHTLGQDAVQGEMHREMVELGPDCLHEIVAGADHDSIVSNEGQARRVGRLIADFVARARTRTGVRVVA